MSNNLLQLTLELSDSCDIPIIMIVVEYRDNDSMQLYYRNMLDLSMLCQKHEKQKQA